MAIGVYCYVVLWEVDKGGIEVTDIHSLHVLQENAEATAACLHNHGIDAWWEEL